MTWHAEYTAPGGIRARHESATWKDAADGAWVLIEAHKPEHAYAATVVLLREAKPGVPTEISSAKCILRIYEESGMKYPAGNGSTYEAPAHVPPVADHADREHAALGASSCARWWNCPGSLRLSAGRVSAPSKYAAEGTAAHEVAAACLTTGQDAIEWVGRMCGEFEVDADFAEALQAYLDECRKAPMERMVEARFDLAAFDPPAPMYGTADFVAYDALTRTLHVYDLKFGRGVRVEAEGNAQLRYYALGATLAFGRPVSVVDARIIQPRGTGGHPVRRAVWDAAELAEWSGELIARATDTLAPDAALAAGAWCRFCPAAGVCPAQAAAALDTAQVDFAVAVSGPDTPIAAPAASTLTPEQIASILDRLSLLEEWISAVRSYAMARGGVPGWKVVMTEGRDAWRDPAEAAETLQVFHEVDPFAKPKIDSPAQIRDRLAETLPGKTKKAREADARKILAPLLHRPNTGVALVPESDPRPAIAGGGSEFAALPAEPVNPENPQ